MDEAPDPTLMEASRPSVREAVELLFFAYRDFTADADALLQHYAFGRAHHRVLHFVGRNPGISVSDLLAILRITKQSLARVLGQLVREGFIIQQPGDHDRRLRLLRLTDKGVALHRQLMAVQERRVAEAFERAGADAVEGYRRVLIELVNAADRERIVGIAGRP